MIKIPNIQSNIDDIATWAKYNKKLCEHCGATCCSLPVEVQPKDLVRMGIMDEFELEESLKLVAKRLMKEGVIDHFHSRTATFTLARMANGDCLYLDKSTRRCTIYQKRPDTCRNHPQIGPRSGYCAFQPKIAA